MRGVGVDGEGMLGEGGLKGEAGGDGGCTSGEEGGSQLGLLGVMGGSGMAGDSGSAGLGGDGDSLGSQLLGSGESAGAGLSGGGGGSLGAGLGARGSVGAGGLQPFLPPPLLTPAVQMAPCLNGILRGGARCAEMQNCALQHCKPCAQLCQMSGSPSFPLPLLVQELPPWSPVGPRVPGGLPGARALALW